MYALGNILKRHPAKRNIESLSLRISNYWYSSSAALIGDDWLEDQCNDIPSVHVHMHGLSAMHTDGHKFIPYPTGHAWQHKCLNEQLKHERELRKGCSSNVTRHNPLNDKIFIIQHDHVYTLGRGADENHLTFLNKFCEKDNEVRQDMRNRLSRQARGKDSARLDSASASHSNKSKCVMISWRSCCHDIKAIFYFYVISTYSNASICSEWMGLIKLYPQCWHQTAFRYIALNEAVKSHIMAPVNWLYTQC
mmetsp:Transcript_36509/g.44022  ORF Transcript_36509/g.44022 Transcript_36509/m.44022 type:complete len:250 (-) Transcript_36509:614-1363(-)